MSSSSSARVLVSTLRAAPGVLSPRGQGGGRGEAQHRRPENVIPAPKQTGITRGSLTDALGEAAACVQHRRPLMGRAGGGRAPLCCRPCWARGGCAGAKAEMRHTVWLRGFGPARPGAARRGWGCLRLGGSGCSARCCCPPPCCPPSRPAIKRLCPCHGRRRALRQDCRCARTTPCPGSAGGLRRENGEMGKWGGPGANGCCAPRWLRGGRAQHGAGVTPQRAPTGTRHGVGWCKGGLGAAGTGCGCARLAAGTPVHRVGVLSRRSPQALPSVPSPLVLLPAGAAGHGGSGRGLGALGRRRALLGGGCNPSCVISQSSAVRARGLCLAQRGAPSPAQPRGEERGHCSRCPLHRTGGLVWGFGTR